MLAAAILLLPWYRLGQYEPNGWDASFWLRVTVILALLNLLTVRADARGAGSPALAAAALALVAMRVVLPPDFGFDFDGLEVPVERRFGAWVGLGAAASVLAAALLRRVPRKPPSRAGGW